MAKAKARKKTRRTDKRPPIDSTPGVAFSLPPPSAEPSEPSEAAAGEPARASDVGEEPPPVESIRADGKGEDEKGPEAKGQEEAKGREAKGQEAKGSEPNGEDEPDAPASADDDPSGEFGSEFFAKSEEEIHLEEARREAPDLDDDELATPVPRRHVHRRAHQIVVGVVGLAALIGIAGAVMRRATPRAIEAQAAAAPVATTAPFAAPTPTPEPPKVSAEPASPPPVESASAAPVEGAPAAPVESAAPAVASASAAPVESAAPAVASAAPAPVESAAPTVASAALMGAPAGAAPVASAAPAPSADPDDALTAGQALAQARAAIAANNATRAAALAKKAIAKGAGGSAYYVLGAAYQTMGANGAAKSAYKTCANSGCAEASECASLLEAM